MPTRCWIALDSKLELEGNFLDLPTLYCVFSQNVLTLISGHAELMHLPRLLGLGYSNPTATNSIMYETINLNRLMSLFD